MNLLDEDVDTNLEVRDTPVTKKKKIILLLTRVDLSQPNKPKLPKQQTIQHLTSSFNASNFTVTSGGEVP